MHRIQLTQKTEKLIIKILAKHAKLSPEIIDPEESLEKYGIDSLMIINLNREMEGIFGELSRTLFFEYSTINALTEYFVLNHTDKLLEIFREDKKEKDIQLEDTKKRVKYEDETPSLPTCQRARRRFINNIEKPSKRIVHSHYNSNCIAIIGISGRYPMADNLDEFWENLKSGRDCVSEVPPDRWDIKKYYHPDKEKKDKMYAKWGGFINDMDKFDALFFNISPREAQNMDPHERLFLETAWSTFEDAGYTKSSIDNRKIGVFTGVMFDHYQLYGNEVHEKALIPTSSHASVANRVSYFFNLHGPSIAVDTMCSSSLTAIHLACESLKKGESEMALAGGVSLTIHPLKYRILCQQRFVSSDGRCRTFGEGGDGYVPGEGVGAVLLKPLEKAIEDNDRIYAVIRSITINHGGKTNGYSVPNPNAQESVIKEAIKSAEIHPETINYIEAHGTGTILGDPIEITGLVKAFGEWNVKKGSCSIGSVKSNIGHLEAAAGIAGLTKVVLMLQKRMLVPSIHSEKLNSNIRFDDSPFYVQHSYEEWKRPVSDEISGMEIPRRAGLSAFGAGGTNVHVILEEYNALRIKSEKENYPEIVVLSAKNQDRLLEYAERVLKYFEVIAESDYSKGDLFRNVIYTLQVGREALEERVAFEASDFYEAIRILTQIVEGKSTIDGVHRGRAENIKKNPELWKRKPEYIIQLLEESKLHEISKIWVNGGKFDWNLFYSEEKPIITTLPGYPFARERYWVSLKNDNNTASGAALNILHPLVDSNHSTFEMECFKKKLKVDEFFIKDHKVAGKMLLPGVAHLEMAREACKIALERPVRVIEDILWLRPIEVEDEKTVVIELLPEEGHIKFLIYDEYDRSKLFSQGRIPIASVDIKDEIVLDIDSIRERCPRKMDMSQVYDVFEKTGFEYGDSFRVTKELWCGEWESIGLLDLPYDLKDKGGFVLHPSLADGALRSALGIKEQLSVGMVLRVPFSLKRLEIFSELPAKCYSYAVINPDDREMFGENVMCDIFVSGMEGHCVAKLSGFCARPLSVDLPVHQRIIKNDGIHYFYPTLKGEALSEDYIFTDIGQTKSILLFDDRDSIKKHLEEFISERGIDAKVIQVRNDNCYRKYDDFAYGIRPLEYDDYLLLFNELKANGVIPSHIIHMLSMSANSVSYIDAVTEVEVDGIEKELENGLFSIINLFKAVTKVDSEWKIRCIFSYPSGEFESLPQHKAVAGFANSTQNINHNFEMVLLKTDGDELTVIPTIVGILYAPDSAKLHNGVEIEVYKNKLYRRVFEPLENNTCNVQAIKHEGVYLITGGLGGIGTIFSNYFAEKYKAKLILTGRSELTENGLEKIRYIEKLGGEVIYIRADISVYKDVSNIVNEAINRFGKIDGVLHSAGVIDGTSVLQASIKDFQKVMNAKLKGTMYLDMATCDKELDFFVMFSSVSSIMGDYGMGSYGAANAFMDGYSIVREALRKCGLRKGCTVSINWPLWEGGGMTLPESVNEVYSLYAGMRAITPEEGIQALEHCIEARLPQVFVACGDYKKICRILKIKKNIYTQKAPASECSSLLMSADESNSIAKANVYGEEAKKELNSKTEGYIRNIIARIINLPAEKVNPKTEFDDYGIDSVMIMELNSNFEKDFRNLPKTIFFEHKTIESLTGYFVKNHEEELIALFGLKSKKSDELITEALNTENERKDLSKRFIMRKGVETPEDLRKGINKTCDIAIIGVGGRYPMAKDLNSFWENLRNGIDCISEIPTERWDYKKYYNPEKGKDAVYSKWGGFIDDVDKFDPFFFNMSPRESEMIDPQERIFIETVWHAFEDAGYTRKSLKNNKVGVFVGAMYGHYQLFGVEETIKGNTFATASFFSSIANRVSYIMDFKGPSLAMDTACSSSLEALRLACMNIRNGSCDIAVAGGVNLSLHPSKYIFLCQAKFLSTDGRCRSFGEGGDGYVPGEGVGAVILKPLEKAVADGDRIYALIKGIATNHGGKTNGYSVPNPAAQAELISDALQNAEIDSKTISYIEAHGTGTILGDPIEIAGLVKAFGENTEGRMPCSIGSVKSNIGHLESAAGIAALTKVILQFKHKKLVPSLHSQRLNPNIDFDRSGFKVQQQLEEWKQPVLIENGIEKVYPRRAGISAFGAGGTNVHVVLEEYDANAKSTVKPLRETYLFVLSARSIDKLKEIAFNLSAYLKAEMVCMEDKLDEIAYTLQVGREGMEQRLAFTASKIDEIIVKLDEFINNGQALGTVYGSVESIDSMIFNQDREDVEYLNSIIRNKNLEKLARLWTKGAEFDWKLLYGESIPMKISLPCYPFERERCWLRIPNTNAGNIQYQSASSIGALVDANISTLMKQLYIKSFSKNDDLIAAHSVAGRNVLPGAAYIEMARSAGELAGGRKVKVIKDVLWIKQFNPKERDDLYISYFPEGNDVLFNISANDKDEKEEFCKGKVCFEDEHHENILVESSVVDIDKIREKCSIILEGNEVTELFESMGFGYGEPFKVIDRLYCCKDKVLAYMRKSNSTGDKDYVLDPFMLDGALRVIAGIGIEEKGSFPDLRIPFSLGRLDIYREIPDECFVYAERSKTNSSSRNISFDIWILTLTGEIIVKMSQFEVLSPSNDVIPTMHQLQEKESYYIPIWESSKPDGEDSNAINEGVLVLLGSDDRFVMELKGLMPQNIKIVQVKTGSKYKKVAWNKFIIDRENQEHYARIMEDISKEVSGTLYFVHMFCYDNDLEQPEGNGQEKVDAVINIRLSSGLYSVLKLFKAVKLSGYNAKVRCLFSFPADAYGVPPDFYSVSGFAASTVTVNPKFELKSLCTDIGLSETIVLAKIIADELKGSKNFNGDVVKYEKGQRLRKSLRELNMKNINDSARINLKERGVYVITGGLGGLGSVFAKYLAQKYNARMALIGRSTLDVEKEKLLAQINDMGAEATYIRADVGDPNSLRNALDLVRKRFGCVNGVIHSAGIAEQIPVEKADSNSFEKMLKSKVHGSAYLDFLTREEPLDFFIMFSSVSSVMGDFGATAYAAANAYMDAFATLRDTMYEKGERNGRCISIGWPLWKGGGIQLDKEAERIYFGYTGMESIDDEEGTAAFERIISVGLPHVIYLKGNPSKLGKALKIPEDLKGMKASSKNVAFFEGEIQLKVDGKENGFYEKLEMYLKKILSETINIAPEKINTKISFDRYGIDSVMIIEFNQRLEKDFNNLPKTLLFEYTSIDSLIGYFMKNRISDLRSMFSNSNVAKAENSYDTPPDKENVISLKADMQLQKYKNRFMSNYNQYEDIKNTENHEKANICKDIAIVGLNGRYPMSKTLEEFWENLKNGRNCISEIPRDRWDYTLHYKVERGCSGKTYSKWGGFIEDVDKFDPMFFNITPLEAEAIDPQERLFLQTSWSVLEDAGYTRKKLEAADFNVGVFVGVMNCNYEWLGAIASARGEETNAHSSYWSIANRVSYCLNLKGPSMAVDTACSSSLTAIHLACESMKRGECKMAIAGGVNLILHPMHYIRYSMMNMITGDSRCKSFGAGADGFVDGEGVGALLLKPLCDAQRDGDRIYAVIKGTHINAGGRTNGYTVPSPAAQATVISEAIKKSGVTPRSISYIEAHGTGTGLGDPIEISGLDKAFSSVYDGSKFCAIGSVKSNIGHLESAAGVAGITKVILQMMHKKLVPSLHSERLNPNISLDGTPFYIQHKLEKWKKPIAVENGEKRTFPRRSGLSSFGAGGANAHIILEEYEYRQDEETSMAGKPCVFVLSAKNTSRLEEYAAKIAQYLEGYTGRFSGKTDPENRNECFENFLIKLKGRVAVMLGVESKEINLDDVIREYGIDPVKLNFFSTEVLNEYGVVTPDAVIKDYMTFWQAFRELFNFISPDMKWETNDESNTEPAICADIQRITYTLQMGREHMKERLAFLAEDSVQAIKCLKAYLKQDVSETEMIFTGTVANNDETDKNYDSILIKELIDAGDYTALAKKWVSGDEINWSLLYSERELRIVSLPTYPFERERYWIPESEYKGVSGKQYFGQSNEEDSLVEILEKLEKGEIDIEEADEMTEVILSE